MVQKKEWQCEVLDSTASLKARDVTDPLHHAEISNAIYSRVTRAYSSLVRVGRGLLDCDRSDTV